MKMQPHYSQFSRENATPSSGTSLLAYILGSTPPGIHTSGYIARTSVAYDTQLS